MYNAIDPQLGGLLYNVFFSSILRYWVQGLFSVLLQTTECKDQMQPRSFWALQICSNSAWTLVTWPVLVHTFSYGVILIVLSALSLVSVGPWRQFPLRCVTSMHRTQPTYRCLHESCTGHFWNLGEKSHCGVQTFTFLTVPSCFPSFSLAYQRISSFASYTCSPQLDLGLPGCYFLSHPFIKKLPPPQTNTASFQRSWVKNFLPLICMN